MEADTRALIEQAHQLRELTKHPGWAVLLDYAQFKIINPQQAKVNDGNVADLAEYKKLAGFLQGVRRAVNIPVEVGTLADNARRRAEDQQPAPDAA